MTKWKKEEKISSMHFLGNRSFSQYLKDLSVIHFSSLLNSPSGPEKNHERPKKSTETNVQTLLQKYAHESESLPNTNRKNLDILNHLSVFLLILKKKILWSYEKFLLVGPCFCFSSYLSSWVCHWIRYFYLIFSKMMWRGKALECHNYLAFWINETVDEFSTHGASHLLYQLAQWHHCSEDCLLELVKLVYHFFW